jgi:hypothetical protein
MAKRMQNHERLLERAQTAKRESKFVDFKSEFDIGSARAWCELIKDIVAFANSGGGAIVIGANNDGSASHANVEPILALDPADVANKIRRYTNCDFSDIEIVSLLRDGTRMAALIVSRSEIPIVFAKPGTYEVVPQQQRTAFSQGTLYFRHGAKSEHGTRDDILKWRDKEIERCRREWLRGIRKVVESPAGHVVSVVSLPANEAGPQSPIAAQVTSDPGAIRIVPQNAEEIWPHRRGSLLKAINKEIRPAHINGHDIVCLNAEFDLLSKRPDFIYKPHRLSSPQYSVEYVAWVVEQFRADPLFFTRIRESYRKRKLASDTTTK